MTSSAERHGAKQRINEIPDMPQAGSNVIYPCHIGRGEVEHPESVTLHLQGERYEVRDGCVRRPDIFQSVVGDSLRLVSIQSARDQVAPFVLLHPENRVIQTARAAQSARAGFNG